MRDRRGFALLAALWLVVAIATVGLALGLEAREVRATGLAAADRAAGTAAAVGGLAIARARLEQVLRRPSTAGSSADQLRAADPWVDPDSLFRDTLYLGNVRVRIHGEDLRSTLNVNLMELPQLRTFLGLVMRDYGLADALAQAITDWRDRDELPQSRGAEREEYLARRRLDLPGNRPFRDVDELRRVEGMTPAVFAAIRPYLRTTGDAAVNINTAPTPVLRAIPGMTDAVVARILSVRSRHQRITSADGLGLAEGSVTFSTDALVLTITAVLPAPARPVQETWTVYKGGDRARVSWLNS